MTACLQTRLDAALAEIERLRKRVELLEEQLDATREALDAAIERGEQ